MTPKQLQLCEANQKLLLHALYLAEQWELSCADSCSGSDWTTKDPDLERQHKEYLASAKQFKRLHTKLKTKRL